MFVYYSKPVHLSVYRFCLSATLPFFLSHFYPYRINSSALNIWVYLQSHSLFTVSASVSVSLLVRYISFFCPCFFMHPYQLFRSHFLPCFGFSSYSVFLISFKGFSKFNTGIIGVTLSTSWCYLNVYNPLLKRRSQCHWLDTLLQVPVFS